MDDVKIPSVKKGSKVVLVGMNAAKFPAKVTSDGADEGRVDLEGGGHSITRSPYDPTGTKPDSWHAVADEPPKPAAGASGAKAGSETK